MEVRPGYKMTQVGVIPEDWEIKSCSHLAERIMVGIVIRPTQYYVPDGVPALRSANIRESGIVESDLVFISAESNALLSKSQTRTGDVLTVRTGYPGTSSVVGPSHAHWNCIDILITRPSTKILSDYLARWVNSAFGKEQVLRTQGGLAQQHFNVSDMKRLMVAVPTHIEQSAICRTMGDMDALLGALERLIAKKRDLKQAATQQLLTGRTRLSGFTGDWAVRTLGQVLEFQVGHPFSSSFFNELQVGVRLVRNRDLKGESQVLYYSGAYDPVFRVEDGDVLVSMDGEFNTCVWSKGSALLNQRVGRIKPLAGLDRRFAFYYLIEPLKQIEDSTSATTVKHLSHDQVEKIEKKLPAIAEQVAIAAVFADMDAEVAALEQRLAKTRALKQGMMQELLTGRIRLLHP